MDTFESMLLKTGWTPCDGCRKYSGAGKTFCTRNEEFYGVYWYYETDQFIIDIHDLFVKKEYLSHDTPDMLPCISFISTYLQSANGECLHPYQALTSNSMFVMSIAPMEVRFLLHANFPYVRVGINFKNTMIDQYILNRLGQKCNDAAAVFFETRELVTKPMEKLANSILNCTMASPAAELFFEAKAKEWLSITLDAYLNKAKAKPISVSDDQAISDVASYINDHYALDISQKLLEKIAMMSGTKLKRIFKQKYQMSITEYSQRKRVNIGETLLLATELDIKDVAKSVGYDSHSRFTTLYKKYKGIYPREVKKLGAASDTPGRTCLYDSGSHGNRNHKS